MRRPAPRVALACLTLLAASSAARAQQPTVGVHATTLTTTEGLSPGTVTVGITLSAASTQTVTVQYTTRDGAAKAPGDYTSTSGTAVFAPGEIGKPIVITITNDSTGEPVEEFYLDLSNPANATLDDARKTAQITIGDDDMPPPTVEFASATYTVAEDGKTATIAVRLSAAANAPVSVKYASSDGSAKAGEDYDPASGTLGFAIGESSKTFTVIIRDDLIHEPSSETVSLALSDPTGATLGTQSTSTLTITDNDPPPPAVQFKSNNYTVSEKAGTIGLEITLSGSAAAEVQVTFFTADGSAKQGEDYQAKTETVTFKAGETSKTVSVAIVAGVAVEPNETVKLQLKDPVGCTLGAPSAGTLTILDEDAPLRPWLTDVSVTAAVKENDSATLKGTVSHPKLGELLRLEFDWGDGGKETQYVTNFSGTVDFLVVHQYLDDEPAVTPSDPYTVKVTASDSSDNKDVVAVGLQVENVAPTFDDVTVSLPDETNGVKVSCTFLEPGTRDTHIVVILWGDISPPETLSLALGERSFKRTHQYQGIEPPDGYVISIQLKDKDTGESKAEKKVPKAQIWGDVSRDGTFDDDDESTERKTKDGLVVIANKEGVYADPDEPARRRKIKVETAVKGGLVRVKRMHEDKAKKADLLLYDAETGGTELFAKEGADEIRLKPGTFYWLQGSINPSLSVREQLLQARIDDVKATYDDVIAVTVLWVDITGSNSGEWKPAPIYESSNALRDQRYGHKRLGVQQVTIDGKLNTYRGTIQIVGSISPNNLAFENGKLTTNFQEPDHDEGVKAKADFGFIFRNRSPDFRAEKCEKHVDFHRLIL